MALIKSYLTQNLYTVFSFIFNLFSDTYLFQVLVLYIKKKNGEICKYCTPTCRKDLYFFALQK